MPAYHCSVSDIPSPLMDEEFILHQGRRIQQALATMHCEGYLHGDVKPSNIFVDSAGLWWLGDFGSSVPLARARQEFRGGTLLFQCEGVDADTPRFDFHGLAITILSKMSLLPDQPVARVIWQRLEVEVAVQTVLAPPLRLFLSSLIL